MNQPKKHHYIPKFYLSYFTIEGFIWVYDRNKNKYRKQKPDNVALINDYYTITDGEGNKYLAIEHFLSDIESKTKPIIDKIEGLVMITDKEKAMLAIYIALQKTRVPGHEIQVREMIQKTMKKYVQIGFSSAEQIRRVIEKIEGETGTTLGKTRDAETLADFVRRGEYTVDLQDVFYQQMIVSLGKELAVVFNDLNWLFLFTTGNSSFITSDYPLVLLPPPSYNPKSFFGIGIITPGAKKIIPLTRKICLIMTNLGEGIIYRRINTKATRAINLNLAASCKRFIFSHSKELLERLVKQTHIDTKK